MIEQNLTVSGARPRTTTIEQNPPAGSPTARVFEIRPDPTTTTKPTVTISGLTMEFGKADSTNGLAGGNVLNQGTLTLSADDIVLREK